MHFHNPHRKDSTITVRVMCAIVFLLFSFSWLYWFQADLLTIAQHILSGGQTTYNRLAGALILTAVLLIVQQTVAYFVRLNKHSHALTYLPSMLLLAMISDINPDQKDGLLLHSWGILIPLILILWGAAIWTLKQLYSYDEMSERSKLQSRQTWINLFEMSVMMLCVAWLGNTHIVMHFRAHAEVALSHDHIEEVLRTGYKSDESDAQLTMLRAYALSQKNALGQCLFEYPVVGKGSDLLPMRAGVGTYSLLLSRDDMFAHLGAIPVGVNSAERFFQLLDKDSIRIKTFDDYRLCALLVDKKIDLFAQLLPQYYAVDDTLPHHYRGPLPKHYKEALILYTHLRSHPLLEFHDASMDEDWDNFQKLKRLSADRYVRKGKLYKYYRSSYWYYYFCQ